MKRIAFLHGVVVVTAITSCSTTFYQGKAGPESQAAVVASADTVVAEIDGMDVQELRGRSRARFVLPPGPHVIGFSFRKVTPGFFVTTTTTSNYLRVCLMAEAGGHYLTRAEVGEDSWTPIIDEVDPDGPASGGRRMALDCSYDRLFPEAVAAEAKAVPTPPAQQEPPPAVTPAVTPAATPPTATDGSAPAAAEGSDAPSPEPAPPPRPAPPRSGARRAASLWRRLPIWRPVARPMVDGMWNLGFAFGGANLVTARLSNGETEELNAGQGVTTSAGLMYTPLWLASDFVGLGIGGEAGLKYDSISASNGSISLTRFPVAATLHSLIRTGDQWFVMLSGGVEKDLAIELSGSGVAGGVEGAALTGQAGGRFRLGMYYRESDLGAITFGLGYTRMHHSAPGGTFDASSFNLWLSLGGGYQTIAQPAGGPS